SMHKRKTTQPVASSAGCIFKNPSKDLPAGKLVDELGLKDMRVGAARVSEVHGNFIVNDGGAPADEGLERNAPIPENGPRGGGVEVQTGGKFVGNDAK